MPVCYGHCALSKNSDATFCICSLVNSAYKSYWLLTMGRNSYVISLVKEQTCTASMRGTSTSLCKLACLSWRQRVINRSQPIIYQKRLMIGRHVFLFWLLANQSAGIEVRQPAGLLILCADLVWSGFGTCGRGILAILASSRPSLAKSRNHDDVISCKVVHPIIYRYLAIKHYYFKLYYANEPGFPSPLSRKMASGHKRCSRSCLN